MKRKIVILLLINLLFIGTHVSAQKHSIIIYRYNQDSIKQDSYNLKLMRIFGLNSFGESIYYPGKLISFHKKKDYSETICDYIVKDTACAFIHEGFGHQTFAIPGDTMIMNVYGTAPTKVNNQYLSPWFRFLSYEGKNKFVYSLFDSLAFVAGELRYNSMDYKPSDNLDAFCSKANSIYTKQNLFLDQYCFRHNVGIQFKELAKAEIKATYINNLITPLEKYDTLTINDYPKTYREVLLKSSFNNPSIYFKTAMYSSTAYAFTALVLPNRRTSHFLRDIDLKKVYETIKLNYSDSIRNHFLTSLLSNFLGNPNFIYPSMDSLILDFKSIYKNKIYTHYLDSLNTKRKAQGAKQYSFKGAMLSKIIDTKDQILVVKHLFKSKPLLIICWASWCAPCLREIPSEKKLQQVYGDKVDFIYLSFDKTKKPWLDKLQTLGIKGDNNYLLTKYFTSDLAGFYKINSIPYYLLYDKKGNKVEIKDLRPSNNGFKSVLDKLIR
jgi:thiol-disulfide isomerase/thioredoxin